MQKNGLMGTAGCVLADAEVAADAIVSPLANPLRQSPAGPHSRAGGVI